MPPARQFFKERWSHVVAFRIWEKTAPTLEYSGYVKLSGNYQKENPTVYELRHYDGFNQLSRINQDAKEITYQYRGDRLRH